MPRKSIVEELQNEEPAPSSPVRRSTRLVSGNGTAGAQRPTTEPILPARATKGRRASAQDTEEEKVESKPVPKTRRASLLIEEEQAKEPSTPTRRGRKPSVTKESENPEETVKPKPVRGRRASNTSVEDPEEKPQKTAAVRTRRGSATIEPEPAPAKTPAKATARRKGSTSEIAASEEVSTPAKRVTRGRRNSDVEIIEDTKPATRGRRKSITQEEETKVEEVKPIARRGRRTSTDSLASDTGPGTPSRRTTRRSSINQEQEVAKDDADNTVEIGEISPIIKDVTVRITPFKKRRIIEQVEADLDLSIINESVGDDANNSNLNESTKSDKIELENKQVSPSSRKRLSVIDESETPLRKSPRLGEKSSPKGTPQRVNSPINKNLNSPKRTPQRVNSPSNENPYSVKVRTPKDLNSSQIPVNQESQVSTTSNDSLKLDLSTITDITQKSHIEEKLNASTESVGSNKENITINEILEKSVQEPIVFASRVSNVFKPNQREYSFMEPMEVDQTINQSLMEKSVALDMSSVASNVNSPLVKEKIVADSTSNHNTLDKLSDSLNGDEIKNSGSDIKNPEDQDETQQDLNASKDALKSIIISGVMSVRDETLADSTSNQKKRHSDHPNEEILDELEDMVDDENIIENPEEGQDESKPDLDATNMDDSKSVTESDLISNHEKEDDCPVSTMTKLEDDEIENSGSIENPEEQDKPKRGLDFVIVDKVESLAKSESSDLMDFTQDVVETKKTELVGTSADSEKKSAFDNLCINILDISTEEVKRTATLDPSKADFLDAKAEIEEPDTVAAPDNSFTEIEQEIEESHTLGASKAKEGSETSVFEVTKDDWSIIANSSKVSTEVTKVVDENSVVINETLENIKIGHSSSPIDIRRKSLRKSKSPQIRISLQKQDESKLEDDGISSPIDSRRKSLRKSKSPQVRISLQKQDESKLEDDCIRMKTPQKVKSVEDKSSDDVEEHIKPDEESSQAPSEDSIEDKEPENLNISKKLETLEDQKIIVDESGDEDNGHHSDEAEEIEEADENEEQASETENVVEETIDEVLVNKMSKKNTPTKESPKSKRWSLDEFASAKLTEYLESKTEYVEDSSDDDSKDNEGDEDNEKDGDDSVEYDSFIDGMAEEGEEDTPSEDSNQIVDNGESIGSSDSAELSTNEDYELDSFICDEEHAELLSGEEYDLDNKKKEKKKSRIMNNDQFGDEEIIKIPQKQEKEKPRKKPSRIIPVSSSSDEEVSLHIDEYVDSMEKELIEKGLTESSIILIEDSKNEESIEKKESDSDCEIQEPKSNNDSDKMTTEEETENSQSLNLLNLNESKILEPTITTQKSDMNNDSKIDESKHEVSITDARSSLNLLNQSRHRKSSLSIQENIFVDGVKDPRLCQRINSLVESFCSTVKKGEISLNLSLEFEDATEDTTKGVNILSNVTIQKATDEEEDVPMAGPSGVEVNNSADQVDLREVLDRKSKLNITNEPVQEMIENIEETISDEEPSEELNKSAQPTDLREVLNRNLKRRLSKSLSEVYEESKKAKKRKKNNGKEKSKPDLTEYLGANSFGLMNQLITDVKNRPRRKIKPTSFAAENESWTSTVVSNLKPSTSVLKEEKKPVVPKPKIHPKDFKNQLLTDPKRVRRVETKTLLKKKGGIY